MTKHDELLATARQLRQTAAALESAAAACRPAHVGSYFADLFPEYGGEVPDYSEFPVNSVCGVRCVEIMHRAKAFLDSCDPLCAHAILGATVHAMSIVCFG